MATWEDGPEYAPLERPDAFAGPGGVTTGLQAPAPPPVTPAAPTQRPVFDGPALPAPALADLVPEPPEHRDPHLPFDVAASVMTAESSAWAAAHRNQPPSGPATAPALPPPSPTPPQFTQRPVLGAPPLNGQSSAYDQSSAYGRPGASGPGPQPNGQVPPGPGLTGSLPPQAGFPAYPPPAGPGAQPLQPPGQPTDGGPFPAPGTPQWFAPPAYQPPPPARSTPTARAVLAAATPGMLITLVLGGFIWVLAPITLAVAFVISSRMTYGRKPTRTAFAAVLSFLGLVGLLSLVTADGLFSQWWDTVAGWACFASWVMLLTAVISTYLAVKQGRVDPPPGPRALR